MKVKGIHAAPALIIIILALCAAAGFLDFTEISGGQPMLTVTVLQLVILGIPCVFYCLLRGHEFTSKLRLRLMSGRQLVLTLYAFVLTLFGSMALSLMMYMLFPEAFASNPGVFFGVHSAEASDGAIYAAISLAVLPAVLEEFLFRGVVSAEYSPYGAVTAAVMSSLAFSMLHMDFVRLPVYFFTGIILALTAGAANSIYASMLVHAANNVFVLFFEKYVYAAAAKSGGGPVLLFFVIISVTLIFAVLFFGRAQKLYFERARKKEAAPLVRGKREGELPGILQALTAPTFILLAIFYIILTAVI